MATPRGGVLASQKAATGDRPPDPSLMVCLFRIFCCQHAGTRQYSLAINRTESGSFLQTDVNKRRTVSTDKNDPMFSLSSPHLTSVDGAFVGVQDIAGATTRQAFWCSHSFPTMSWVSYIDELSASRETLCNGDLRSYLIEFDWYGCA